MAARAPELTPEDAARRLSLLQARNPGPLMTLPQQTRRQLRDAGLRDAGAGGFAHVSGRRMSPEVAEH